MTHSDSLVGRTFGKWTVVGGTQATYGGRLRHLWDCRCECGTVRGIANDALLSGKSTQCRDCGNREKAASRPRLVHGGTGTRLYNIWSLMKRRCEAPECADFPLYGGRGISVCPEWRDFANFRDWALGSGYSAELTIDRRDNNLGYHPDNCRWATRTIQNRNRRNNQRFAWRGRSLMLSEIAEAEGVSPDILRQRVRRDGLSVTEAVARSIHHLKEQGLA